MPFTHHSHSGQFCPGHARSTLEEMVQKAISVGMQVFAMTEHMPRHEEDFYPEEVEAGFTSESHFRNEAEYFQEAVRLREKYKDQIAVPIGFECDWIRPSSSDLIQESLRKYPFDFFIGSVHHVHAVPIDVDRAGYVRAKNLSGGTDRQLFADYFDWQLTLLQALQPPVVGHFDLICLKSDDPNRSWYLWPDVWQRIVRNLKVIASYGGILELNHSSLRKGILEPYPKAEICRV